jgi:hypothetical protein
MNALPFTWKNVIATKPGLVYPGQQVILCAHYDNTSQTPLVLAPGADDNGSGSIAVVEAARIFKDVDFERTIKFCIWGGEEQWLLGSAAYASEAFARGDTIAGVYNLDLIAWDGNGDDSVEFHCGTMNSSRILGNLLVSVIYLYDLELCPEILTWESTNRSDHTSFWDYNYPAILGIEDFYDDFNPYYHTLGDNVTHIDTALFTEYTKAVVGATATLARVHDNMALAAKLEPLPQGVSLISNYPNPFNASTLLSYRLDKPGPVNLAIYNLLGQKVATLADGLQDAGEHQITWNSVDNSSGIYFARLVVAKKTECIKLVMIK